MVEGNNEQNKVEFGRQPLPIVRGFRMGENYEEQTWPTSTQTKRKNRVRTKNKVRTLNGSYSRCQQTLGLWYYKGEEVEHEGEMEVKEAIVLHMNDPVT